VAAITRWAERHLEQVDAARRRYGSRRDERGAPEGDPVLGLRRPQHSHETGWPAVRGRRNGGPVNPVTASSASAAAVDRAWFGKAVAISLAATALGLARFGYTVLLPAMRSDLAWSYTQAGGMNAANALGYLLGSLLSVVCIAAVGERRAFTVSFALTAASILTSGFATSYVVLLLLRGIAGGAGAVLFIAGGALASRLATASRLPGLVLGVFFAGVGPGILISALLAPAILRSPHGWRVGWIVMGAVAAVSALVAVRAVGTIPPPGCAPSVREPAHLGQLAWGVVAFTLFGLGYISYMTFIIAYYRQAGRTVSEITLFWAVLAIAATASGWTWKSLLDRAGGGTALATLLGVVTVGAGVPLVTDGVPAMLASAVLFGGAFLSVIAAVTQLVRRVLPAHQWTLGLAVATTLFAAGQTVGPVLTGVLADQAGGLEAGLAASMLILAISAPVALLQRPRRRPPGSADDGPVRSGRHVFTRHLTHERTTVKIGHKTRAEGVGQCSLSTVTNASSNGSKAFTAFGAFITLPPASWPSSSTVTVVIASPS